MHDIGRLPRVSADETVGIGPSEMTPFVDGIDVLEWFGDRGKRT